MKKNKLFLLGLIALFAAVLSLSLVSNTFAKYTSSDTGSDSARVAKWGVEVKLENYDLFDESYAKDDSSFTLDANSVVSQEDVLAPGTSGELAGIVVSGTPEVAVRVSYVTTVSISGWSVTGKDFYCPLEVVIKYGDNAAVTIKGADYATAALFKAAIEEEINAYTSDYEAGTDLSAINDDLAISWSWAYSTNDTNDGYDTDLGDQAANGNASTFGLDVKLVVEQID